MIVKYTNKEMELLARLMRAEALGEGNLGMLMVGNVGINRVLADCLTFKDINSIYKMIYQSPGGFSGTNSSLFYGNPTEKEKLLAKRVLRGEFKMALRVGINGFGRIGRCTLRAIYERNLQNIFNIVAINAAGDLPT